MVKRKSVKNIVIDPSVEKKKILCSISDYLYGFEDVESSLEKKFEMMLKERCGTSLTFLGPSGSGKRSFIRRICSKYSNDIELIEHNASFDDIIAAKAKIHCLEEKLEEKKNVCYVIYDFEKFKGTFGKNVLYTLAQNCRHSPLLLILVGESQKGLSFFEKRIASRLSSDVIHVFPLNTPEKCYDLFKTMITNAISTTSIANKITIPDEIPFNFSKLCRLTPVYPKIKILAKNFIDTHYNNNFKDDPTKLINEWIEVQSNEDLYRSMKERITDRQYSLVLAAAIICSSTGSFFPLRRVQQRYRRIINEKNIKDSTLLFDNDQEFEADVRQLIFNGFFVAKFMGKKIWYLGWNIYPEPFFADELMDDVKEQFKRHLKESTDLRHL